ncbi:hypothetical protein CW745_14050 [Psychromonas sp. psych-6C06]|uniref:AAA family ATPase n=1 Tax=Psychromonas sp. psych-6C06 TaxID=2058089 RepID=UPI000C332197|nr:AAA family ATPase [Psychromonas sp. psych-6C06]PKF60649.1 hypothetical protein CW745_14050 [Psychromonas sp. psych-6C06]
MNFDFEIRNLGKVKHAKLKIAPFTVIAGANSSGKSFISRALYSFFNTINKDHVTLSAMNSMLNIQTLLRSAYNSTSVPSNTVNDLFNELMTHIATLENVISKEFGECTFLEQHARTLILDEYILNTEYVMGLLLDEIANKKKYNNFHERLSAANNQLKKLKTNIKNPSTTLSEKVEQGFNDALKENFQIPNLSDLKSFDASAEEPISFNLGPLGEISIVKESINFKLNAESISEFQSLYNVVFIESPIYWKLRKPLINAQKSPLNIFRRLNKRVEGLSGVPQYFYDLIELVDGNIKSTAANEQLDNLEKNINQTLGGNIELSDSGDISFKDSSTSKNISINLTATGVTNLGIIGLLLKRNVIAKGSFVFVDEPEVNLHPAWQKVMIETLYKLSKSGINVVIASHSIDMMKYVENIMDELSEEEIEQQFAINRLSQSGISTSSEISQRKSIAEIKNDLGASFIDMTLESGW